MERLVRRDGRRVPAVDDGGREMTALGLVFTLGVSVGYAALDLLRKLLAGRVPVVPLLFWMTAGAVPFFAVWAAFGPLEITASYLLPGLGSTALNVVANLAFLRAVQLAGLATTIPLLSLTPVMAALFAVPLLGELPSWRQGAGIVLVVAGALLLGILQTSLKHSLKDRRKELEGALLMVGVAMVWSLTLPLDKLALRSAAPAVHGLVLHFGIAVSMLVLLLGRRELPQLLKVRGSISLVLLTVVCGAAALALQLLALQQVLSGLVESLKRGVGSVAALLVGAFLFHESLTVGKTTAVIIMALGVALILL